MSTLTEPAAEHRATPEVVPFLDLKSMHAPLMEAFRRALTGVIEAQAFILGPAVQQFEANFGRYCDGGQCVGLNSGTSAVHLALLCAGVQPGDDVITTPYSWISTSWAISYIGARPVFADVDPRTGGLDPAAVEAALTRRTTAILPVHLFGHPVDMDAMIAIGRRRGLAVIEDAAQAHGARYRGRPCGALADIAAFSFYPGKNLGAFGEGGALVSAGSDHIQRARRLRDHAQEQRHQHLELGFNMRMDGIQAAILDIKLQRLDDWNRRRRQVAEWYAQALEGLPEVQVPRPAPWAEPAWHLYPIRHPQRDALRRHLEACGIQSAVHYPRPIHLQPAYAQLGYHPGDLPVAEAWTRTELSLPMFPHMTAAMVQRVADAIRSFADH